MVPHSWTLSQPPHWTVPSPALHFPWKEELNLAHLKCPELPPESRQPPALGQGRNISAVSFLTRATRPSLPPPSPPSLALSLPRLVGCWLPGLSQPFQQAPLCGPSACHRGLPLCKGGRQGVGEAGAGTSRIRPVLAGSAVKIPTVGTQPRGRRPGRCQHE